MLPCQDTPAAKSSYSAKIKVPAALTALMSAQCTSVKGSQDSKVFSFLQDIPIPVSFDYL